VPKTLTVDNGA
jgi:transposase InsO family protein